MVVKYNVRGQDHGKNSSGGWVAPKPGTYVCRIVDCKLGRKDKDDPETERLEVVYQIIEDAPSKGYRGYDYISTTNDAVAWKMDQFIQAIGINSEENPEGTFTEKEQIGKIVKVRFADESRTVTDDDGQKVTQVRPRAAGVFLYKGDVDFGDEGKGPFDDDTDSDSDAGGEVDLETLAALADDGDAEAGEAIAAYITEVGADIDPDEYALWSEVVEKIREAMGDEAGADADADDDDDALPYEEWDTDALRAELKVRELNTVGSKATLVARLEKYDAANPLAD